MGGGIGYGSPVSVQPIPSHRKEACCQSSVYIYFFFQSLVIPGALSQISDPSGVSLSRHTCKNRTFAVVHVPVGPRLLLTRARQTELDILCLQRAVPGLPGAGKSPAGLTNIVLSGSTCSQAPKWLK